MSLFWIVKGISPFLKSLYYLVCGYLVNFPNSQRLEPIPGLKKLLAIMTGNSRVSCLEFGHAKVVQCSVVHFEKYGPHTRPRNTSQPCLVSIVNASGISQNINTLGRMPDRKLQSGYTLSFMVAFNYSIAPQFRVRREQLINQKSFLTFFM